MADAPGDVVVRYDSAEFVRRQTTWPEHDPDDRHPDKTWERLWKITLEELKFLHKKFVVDALHATGGLNGHILKCFYLQETFSNDCLGALTSTLSEDAWNKHKEVYNPPMTKDSPTGIECVWLMVRFEMLQISKVHEIFMKKGAYDITEDAQYPDEQKKLMRVLESYKMMRDMLRMQCALIGTVDENVALPNRYGTDVNANLTATELWGETSIEDYDNRIKAIHVSQSYMAKYNLRKSGANLYREVLIRELVRVLYDRHTIPCYKCKSPKHVCTCGSGQYEMDPFVADQRVVCATCGQCKSAHPHCAKVSDRKDHAFVPKLKAVGHRWYRTCAWMLITDKLPRSIRSYCKLADMGTSEQTPPHNASIRSYLLSAFQRNGESGSHALWCSLMKGRDWAKEVESYLKDAPQNFCPNLESPDARLSFLNGVFMACPPEKTLLPHENPRDIMSQGGRFYTYSKLAEQKWGGTITTAKLLPVWYDEPRIQEELNGPITGASSRAAADAGAVYKNKQPFKLCIMCGQPSHKHRSAECLQIQLPRYESKTPAQRGNWVTHANRRWLIRCVVGPNYDVVQFNESTRKFEGGEQQLPVEDVKESKATPMAVPNMESQFVTCQGCSRCGKFADGDEYNAIVPVTGQAAGATKEQDGDTTDDGSDGASNESEEETREKSRVCVCNGKPMTTYHEPDAWYDIQTPFFHDILRHQFVGYGAQYDDICKAIYVLLGRMFFRVIDYDGWQIVLFVKGQAGSGKSTLVDIIKLYFKSADIASFSSNMQETFGLSDLLYKGTNKPKKISLCAEVKSNFGRNVNQGDFQSIVSNESVVCNVKGEAPVTVTRWDRPMFLVGNEYPGYACTSNSIARRFVTADFKNAVEACDRDNNLGRRILYREGAALYVKCVMAYHTWAKLHGEKGLYGIDDVTKKKILTPYYHETRDKMRAESHSLLSFLTNNPKTQADYPGSRHYVRHPNFYVTKERFEKDWRHYCRNTLSIRNPRPFNEDFYYSVMSAENLKVDTSERTRVWVKEKCESGSREEGAVRNCDYEKVESMQGPFITGIGIMSMFVCDEKCTVDDCVCKITHPPKQCPGLKRLNEGCNTYPFKGLMYQYRRERWDAQNTTVETHDDVTYCQHDHWVRTIASSSEKVQLVRTLVGVMGNDELRQCDHQCLERCSKAWDTHREDEFCETHALSGSSDYHWRPRSPDRSRDRSSSSESCMSASPTRKRRSSSPGDGRSQRRRT